MQVLATITRKSGIWIIDSSGKLESEVQCHFPVHRMNPLNPMLEFEPTSQDYPTRVLSDEQRLLYEELQKKDGSLAQIYLGAVSVLKDTENPERVMQAAYSMRELMGYVTTLFGIRIDPIQPVFNELKDAKASWDRALVESDCYADRV